MKLVFVVTKNGETLSRRVCEVVDAASFGAACAQAWVDLERRSLESATSVGALMERLNEAVADQLDGAALAFTKE